MRTVRYPLVTIGALALAAGVLGTGTASAATITYRVGPATPAIYSCTFPGISAQPFSYTVSMDAASPIPLGVPVTPTNITAAATMSTSMHTVLTSNGYDGVRGKADLSVTAVGGTLSAPAITSLNVPTVIWPHGGPATVSMLQDSGSSIPSLTIGTPGQATVSLGTTSTLRLDFHRNTTDGWVPFTVNCGLKITSPVQHPVFSPPFSAF